MSNLNSGEATPLKPFLSILTFLSFFVISTSSCQFTSVKTETPFVSSTPTINKDIEERRKFVNVLNKGNGDAKTSTRGENDEQLVIYSPNITKEECSIFRFGSFGKTAKSLGFLQVVCVNENKTEYRENLNNKDKDPETRQRYMSALNKILLEDNGTAKISISGRNKDEIIIKSSNTPRFDCIDFADSEYGKTAASIGFVRVTCKSDTGFTYSESLITQK